VILALFQLLALWSFPCALGGQASPDAITMGAPRSHEESALRPQAPDPGLSAQSSNDESAKKILTETFEAAVTDATREHKIRIGGGWLGNYLGTYNTCAEIVQRTLPYFDREWKTRRLANPKVSFERIKPVVLLYEGPGAAEFYPFQHIYFGIMDGKRVVGIIDPWAFGDGKLRPPNRSVVYTLDGRLPNKITPILPIR